MKKRVLTLTAIVFSFLILGNIHAMETDVLGGLDVHGFVSQGFLKSTEYNYLAHDSKDGSFQFNEMAISFSKQATDKLRLGIQLFARDLGDVANDKITVDWAYGDYRWKDWLGLRVGKIKIPRALYNETRDADMLRTSVILPQTLYGDLMRDTSIAVRGVGLYGSVDTNHPGTINYQFLGGVVPTDLEAGVGKIIGSSLAGEMDMENAYVGVLSWDTPVEGLALKVSTLNTKGKWPYEVAPGFVTTFNMEKYTTTIYSVEYTWDNLLLAAEYGTIEIGQEILGNSSTNTDESYYVMASYRFTDWLEVGSYYSVYYDNKDDRDGSGLQIDHGAWLKDLTLSCRVDINENWIFKLEGHQMDGTAGVLAVDNPARLERDWFLGAAKMTFSF
jgi:hypothetical protein